MGYDGLCKICISRVRLTGNLWKVDVSVCYFNLLLTKSLPFGHLARQLITFWKWCPCYSWCYYVLTTYCYAIFQFFYQFALVWMNFTCQSDKHSFKSRHFQLPYSREQKHLLIFRKSFFLFFKLLNTNIPIFFLGNFFFFFVRFLRYSGYLTNTSCVCQVHSRNIGQILYFETPCY